MQVTKMAPQKSAIHYQLLTVIFVFLLAPHFSFVFAQTAYYTSAYPISAGTGGVPSPDSGIFAPSPASNLIANKKGRATSNTKNYVAYSIPDYVPVDSATATTQFTTPQKTAPIYSQTSPVLTQYVNWIDYSRNRNVPIKIYRPAYMTEKCPVIIFSHGLGGSHEKCSYLGETWAAQGFISVHIRHVGIDEDVWKRKIRPIKELKDVYGRHWSGRMQANDIQFVLNRLDSLAASDSSFGQVIDMTRVGVAGYDLGGLASMLVAGQLPPDGGASLYDSRVRAIVVMSPPVFSHVSYAPVTYQSMQTPAMFFTGTDDNGWVGTTKSWQRRIPFDYMQGNDRFLVTYQGADHMIYGGHILSVRDDQKYQSNIAQASLLFWRAYLKEEPALSAYFQGPTVGHIAGTFGRVERRLSPTGYEMPTIVQSNTVENVSDFVPDFRQQYVTNDSQE